MYTTIELRVLDRIQGILSIARGEGVLSFTMKSVFVLTVKCQYNITRLYDNTASLHAQFFQNLFQIYGTT